MGYSKIVLGFIFLFNPNIMLIDILPDFIGYILIANALFKFSLLDSRLSAARKNAFILGLITFIKTFVSIFTLSLNGSDRLLLIFVFAVIEVYVGLFFISNLFAGMNFLNAKHNCVKAMENSSAVQFFLNVFIIAKNAAVFLPELFSVFFFDIDSDFQHNHVILNYNGNVYKTILMLFCILVVLGYGIYTAIHTVRYLKDSKKDKEYIASLEASYKENVLNNESILMVLKSNSFVSLSIAAFFFLCNLYVDYINLILPFIFFICLFVAFYKVICKYRKAALWVTSIGTIVSVFSWIFRVIKATDPDTFKLTFDALIPSWIFAISEGVFMITAAVLVALTYKELLKIGNTPYTAQLIKFIVLSVICIVINQITYVLPQDFMLLLLIRVAAFIALIISIFGVGDAVKYEINKKYS